MKQYPKYKDSKISWIGDVPEHWTPRIFHSCVKVKVQTDNVDLELLSVYLDRGVVRFSDIQEKRANATSENLSKYQRVDYGDLVLNNQQAWRGSVGVSKFTGIVSPAYFVFKFTIPINFNFANYLFRDGSFISNYYVASRGVGSIQRNLYYPQLKRAILFLPPADEQQAIVEFLDTAVDKIDRYIAAKEAEIEKLGTLKQSVISQAVTKGLNPNAPMKDSGIPWIGEIPKHWEYKKINLLFSERCEKNHPNEPILCSTQKFGVIPQSMYENRVVVVNKGFDGLKLVCIGDFVISLRSFQGGIEYAYYRGIISAAYTVLSLKNNIMDANYIRLLFKSHPFIQLLQTCVTGIREGQNINYSLLRKQFLPVPPTDEQQAIVKYIDEQVQKIDTSVGNIRQQIEKLKNYKQRLISDAVTGKIDVRERLG
ncbi:MAG: restriction endonuclease subunit S [Lentisphaeria bacterium]|nr:restriction endonuclease subunit S [Lentisphaeria bacterium]